MNEDTLRERIIKKSGEVAEHGAWINSGYADIDRLSKYAKAEAELKELHVWLDQILAVKE